MVWRRLLLAVLCGWAGVAAAAGGAGRVGPGLQERLTTDARVEVVVALRPPSARARNSLGRLRTEIATRQSRVLANASAHTASGDLTIRRQFETVGGFTASVSAAGLAALAADPDVMRIDLPQEGNAALAISVPQIHADVVHALGIDGRGVGVALLDTAIDTSHPDLAGHFMAEECFCSTGCCPGNTARLSGPGSATGTAVDHGTHVAGILVSQGNHQLAATGVAPGAQIVAMRVLTDQLRGDLGDWVAALDWLVAHHTELQPAVRVVNMSLASDKVYPPHCETLDATNLLFRDVIDTLRVEGTLVFTAAGNNGNPNGLTAPACVTGAVAVGAVDGDDHIAWFSNSSPVLALLAPGYPIRSTAPNRGTSVMFGTSMATPHAAGVAAILWQADPSLDPDQVEAHLRRTGARVRDARNGLWFPRIDALGAYRALEFDHLVRGGGSPLTDCLVEWQPTPRTMMRSPTRPRALCHDGDPDCDHDQVPGQCTFELALCFNVPDGRIPACRSTEPITQLTLAAPRLATSDAIDAGNATAVTNALPPMPIPGEKVCTGPIHVTVPIGARGYGERRLHLSVESGDRRDTDRARFICLAPQTP